MAPAPHAAHSHTLCLPRGQNPGRICLGCQQGARLQAAAAGPPAHLPHPSSFFFLPGLLQFQRWHWFFGARVCEDGAAEQLHGASQHSALPQASQRQSSASPVPGICSCTSPAGTVRELCRERRRHLEQQLPMPPDEASHGQEDLLGFASKGWHGAGSERPRRRQSFSCRTWGEGRHRRARPRVYAELSPSWVSSPARSEPLPKPTAVPAKPPSHGSSARKSDLQLVQTQVYLLPAQRGLAQGFEINIGENNQRLIE